MREEDCVAIGLGVAAMCVGVSIVLGWVGYLAVLQVVEWVTG